MTYEAGYQDGYQDAIKDAARKTAPFVGFCPDCQRTVAWESLDGGKYKCAAGHEHTREQIEQHTQEGVEQYARVAQEEQLIEVTVHLYIEPSAGNVDWRGALDENLSGLALVEGGPGGFGPVGTITGVDVDSVEGEYAAPGSGSDYDVIMGDEA